MFSGALGKSLKPATHMPAADARPNVAVLLLAGTPDFFDIVKVFFDRPPIRYRLQDQLDTHRCVCADVCRPSTIGMLQNNDPNPAADNLTGRQQCLVSALGHLAAACILDRFPSTATRRSLLQADPVLSVLARTPALPLSVHRKIKQFGVAAEPGHDGRTASNQRTHQRRRCDSHSSSRCNRGAE